MSVSAVKNKNWKQESAHGRKDGREKMLRQETLWQSRPMRFNGFAWKINHCGIFCASQKGSESKGKVSYHLSSQDRVSSGSHVQILWSVQKRLLCFCPSSGQAGTRRGSCGSDCKATGTQFSHEQGLSRKQAKQQMGNGHLLHSHQAGRAVPVHDPGSL